MLFLRNGLKMEKFKTFTLLFTGEVRGDRSRLLLSLLSNIFLNHPESILDPQNMFRLRLYLLLLFCFECLTDNVD